MGLEQHYTVAQIAERVGISQRQVWREVELGKATKGKQGLYPIRKMSHKNVRIPESAVNRWLGGKGV